MNSAIAKVIVRQVPDELWLLRELRRLSERELRSWLDRPRAGGLEGGLALVPGGASAERLGAGEHRSRPTAPW
jgi:hypothetical protein